MRVKKKLLTLGLTLCLIIGTIASPVFADETVPNTQNEESNILLINESSKSIKTLESSTTKNTENTEEAESSKEVNTSPSNTEEKSEDSDKKEDVDTNSIFAYADFDSNYQNYIIKLQNIKLAKEESLTVAVWSDQNWQDDLKWSDVKVDDSGNATAVIKISDYKSPGKFYAHFYKKTKNNVKSFIDGIDFSVETVSSAKITLESIDKSNGTATICVSDIKSPAGVKKVEITTWCNSNQSDIKWYKAEKKSNGNYYVTFNVENHGSVWTKYNNHVYVTDNNGFRKFVGATTSDFRIKCKDINISFNSEQTIATITVKLVDSLPKNFKSMTAAIWSQKGGQDDITWNDMTYNSETKTFQVKFKTSKLKHFGEFAVHLYEKDINGKTSFVSGKNGNLKLKYETLTLIDDYADTPNKAQTTYTGRITGLSNTDRIKKVKAAVWSDQNGQDDLKWYDLTKDSQGNYKFNFPISNHKTLGKYFCHYYAVTTSGSFDFIDGTTINIDKIKPTAEITVEKSKPGYFIAKINLDKINSPSGILNVTVPIWTDKNGQDDIKWYNAIKQEDGTYNVTVNTENHNFESGKYNIHIYITAGNGIRMISGSLVYDLDNSDIKVNEISISDDEDSSERKLIVYNPSATPVSVAVWSEAKGQDDIKWINAEKKSNGVYTVNLNAYNYLSNGTFQAHAYGNDRKTFLKGMSFTWNAIPPVTGTFSHIGDYKQTDPAWANVPYSDGNMFSHGCGACSLTNVLSITDLPDINLYTVKARIEAVGGVSYGGTLHHGIANTIKSYNYKCIYATDGMGDPALSPRINSESIEKFKTSIKNGNVGILLLGPKASTTKPYGYWTGGGHFTSVMGYRNINGKEMYYIADPVKLADKEERTGWHEWSDLDGAVRGVYITNIKSIIN